MTGPGYVEGALVTGVSAHVLDRILAAPHVSAVLASLPPWMRPEVDATRRAVRRAARAYEALPTAADGNTELPPDAPGPQWEHEITTAEAGAILALSQRRIRQIAAAHDGMGRRTGGRWLLDRSAVLAYRERSVRPADDPAGVAPTAPGGAPGAVGAGARQAA
ncbi:helix-turn-helix domain-containing protein [Kitasatospora sp. NPDC054939]